MAYRVRIESFEGPFDLLLYLVNRQKVDIGSVPINDIADQYLAEVRSMQAFDLDVASDFLLVAATLLEIKAASLVPGEEPEAPEDADEMNPLELRDSLVDRLVEYKKFKNAASALGGRLMAEERKHARPFGPDRSLLTAMPDFLRGVSLDKLGGMLANMLARRDVFLLESEHIAARVIALEERIVDVRQMVAHRRRVRFSDLTEGSTDPHVVVVTFLAILELFKRSEVDVVQDRLFGDIVVTPHELPRAAAESDADGGGPGEGGKASAVGGAGPGMGSGASVVQDDASYEGERDMEGDV